MEIREGRNHFVGWSPPLPSLKAMIGLFCFYVFLFFVFRSAATCESMMSFLCKYSIAQHMKMTLLYLGRSSSSSAYTKKKQHKHHTLCGFLLSETDSPSSYHGERRRGKTVKFSFLSIRTPIINGYEATVTAPIIIIYTHTYILDRCAFCCLLFCVSSLFSWEMFVCWLDTHTAEGT